MIQFKKILRLVSLVPTPVQDPGIRDPGVSV